MINEHAFYQELKDKVLQRQDQIMKEMESLFSMLPQLELLIKESSIPIPVPPVELSEEMYERLVKKMREKVFEYIKQNQPVSMDNLVEYLATQGFTKETFNKESIRLMLAPYLAQNKKLYWMDDLKRYHVYNPYKFNLSNLHIISD